MNITSRLYALDLDPTPVAPPGVEGPMKMILDWMMFGGLAAVIVGFISAGILLAISNSRGTGNENVKKLGYVAIGGIVVSSAGALAHAFVS